MASIVVDGAIYTMESVEIDPIYDPAHLLNAQTYTGVLVLRAANYLVIDGR
ncbi:MAG: hypothetical protein HUK22_06405 [Thermoguttaceae bacterium]|nr:hypothetical protein [Thermoguttaceae bacterium]